jgi:ribosomal protein S18 acetylase RimI-like enzyme
MRDFPFFNTEFGVASLVLKEIPYQGTAYIILRDASDPEKLLAECVDFCRVCGAEAVYATGHEILERYPFYTAMWLMRCEANTLPDTDASLFPVQENTLEQWQRIYNEKVRRVPNGAWMTQKDAQKMLEDGTGYFVHRGGTLLGIGKVSGCEIQWVAAVVSGGGKGVVCALAHAVWADSLELTVASENSKAVRLYESLGFVRAQEISRWYNVYKTNENNL